MGSEIGGSFVSIRLDHNTVSGATSVLRQSACILLALIQNAQLHRCLALNQDDSIGPCRLFLTSLSLFNYKLKNHRLVLQALCHGNGKSLIGWAGWI
jgi:hypothetical protein